MKKQFDYSSAKSELENIINWFEDSSHDINESFDKYLKASKLIDEMQAYLTQSQAKIKLISKKLNK